MIVQPKLLIIMYFQVSNSSFMLPSVIKYNVGGFARGQKLPSNLRDDGLRL